VLKDKEGILNYDEEFQVFCSWVLKIEQCYKMSTMSSYNNKVTFIPDLCMLCTSIKKKKKNENENAFIASQISIEKSFAPALT
jgi:hypothetical protein